MRLVSFLFLLFASGATGQEPCKPLIWSNTQRLIFEDFCGLPDRSSSFGALSYCYVNEHYSFDYDTLEYDIFSLFNCAKSWININDSGLLAHEQMHFDIGEIHSRSIKKKLNSLTGKRVDDSQVYYILTSEMQNMISINTLFDSETSHGTREMQTKVWAERIKNILDSLDGYKEPKGKVPIVLKN